MASKSLRRLTCSLCFLLGAMAAAADVAIPTKPLVVEDFESGQIDPTHWSELVTGKNTLLVQSERAAHGRFALRAHCEVPTSKTWAFLSATRLPDALRKHHFGRAYVFITPKSPARHTIFLTAGTSGFPFDRFQEIAGGAKGTFQLTYVELKPTGDNEDYHFAGEMPLGRWFCLEWEFNDEPNQTTLWIDGGPAFQTGFISKITQGTTGLVGGFTDFRFGFRLWGTPSENFDIFYDDIALDVKRIGPISEKP